MLKNDGKHHAIPKAFKPLLSIMIVCSFFPTWAQVIQDPATITPQETLALIDQRYVARTTGKGLFGWPVVGHRFDLLDGGLVSLEFDKKPFHSNLITSSTYVLDLGAVKSFYLSTLNTLGVDCGDNVCGKQFGTNMFGRYHEDPLRGSFALRDFEFDNGDTVFGIARAFSHLKAVWSAPKGQAFPF